MMAYTIRDAMLWDILDDNEEIRSEGWSSDWQGFGNPHGSRVGYSRVGVGV
jgi:hypothetical protein